MNQRLQEAWKERKKLRAEGDKLRAEGYKLCAEGDKFWLTAVIEVYGNIPVSWDGDRCILNIPEIYE